MSDNASAGIAKFLKRWTLESLYIYSFADWLLILISTDFI